MRSFQLGPFQLGPFLLGSFLLGSFLLGSGLRSFRAAKGVLENVPAGRGTGTAAG